MAIHQADLHGSKKEQQRIDRDAMRGFLEGDLDLADGLGLDAEMLKSMRRQALALYEAGKWQRCIDIILAVVALGSVHPADALMLSGCYREMGMPNAAMQCAEHADRLMKAMGVEIDWDTAEGDAE